MAVVPDFRAVNSLFAPFADVTRNQWLSIATAAILVYSLVKGIYNLYFHPIAKYPGPKIAAISNVWYAYNWLTGKWPWKVEKALKRYGDVVRIAPNELLFITPQAGRDIYATHEKNLEFFVKTDFEDLGEDGGISSSPKNTKAKEATLQEHVDFFVKKMKEVGGGEEGAEMRRWADWLAMDISADMTYNRRMNQMKDSSFFGTINQIMKKFPLLSPLMYLFIPPSVWLTLPRVLKVNSQEVQARIERRGKTEHLDYFEQIVQSTGPTPTDKKQIKHLEQVAGQLLMAGWEPVSNQFYSTIFFLLKEPKAYAALVEEVRGEFKIYDDITPDSIANLKYLHSCLQETFRLHQNTTDGLPRLSPGAMVDGHHVPQGVVCQISYFAAARSQRYFAEPLQYRPQRWLPSDHPHYDPKFTGDDAKAFLPFNQGPRMCPGSAIAWNQTKLFIAKVFWSFNLEMVKGHDLDFERDFIFYSMWTKPELWVRFGPVAREERSGKA